MMTLMTMTTINIESEVDVDVLASRRRFAKHNDPSHGRHNSRGRAGGNYDNKEDYLYPDRIKVNKPPTVDVALVTIRCLQDQLQLVRIQLCHLAVSPLLKLSRRP